MRVKSRTARRGSTGERGSLSLMDVVVIGILLAVLLVAARQDFPGLLARATPVAETTPQQGAAD
jgi:hypothetical protein